MNEVNKEELWRRMQIPGADIKIPPNCFEDMGAEIVGYEEGRALRTTFPVEARYQNPAGAMQGGYLMAAFDNTFGPLSFLVAKKPTTTLDMSISFVRPVTPSDKMIIVEVHVISLTRSYILMEGKAFNEAKKLVASSHTRMKIFS